MRTNTKQLFGSLIKMLDLDCVCDIGSMDGKESLFFRYLLPHARVIAFEANPINYNMMQSNPTLAENRIEMFPYAITNRSGVASFHVTDVDYNHPNANKGTSSLLIHPGLKVKYSVDVETQRLDDFILQRYLNAFRMALWIDVEGVEYSVLDGIERIVDCVYVVHVETAKKPMRQSQQTMNELTGLMNAYGFLLCGSNIKQSRNWGNVVFIRKAVIDELESKVLLCKCKAYFSKIFFVDKIAVMLKLKHQPIYSILRNVYRRLVY